MQERALIWCANRETREPTTLERSSNPSRDLLFGLLALQNGLVDQAQLVAAFQAWTRDRSRRLAEYLVGRGALDAEQRSGHRGDGRAASQETRR